MPRKPEKTVEGAIAMLEALFLALSECYFFLSYVSGRNAFPPRLTPAQERDCIDRMRTGDEDARRMLIEHNLRLVAHVAGKYRNTGLENDDLISIGTIGLIKAVSTFSPESGTALATYAARCIENEILMVRRAGKKRRREGSMQEPVGADKEGNELTLLDILGTEGGEVEEEVERRSSAVRVRRLIRTALLPRERLVLELRYGLSGDAPAAQREVAQALGISRSYVSRIEKRAIEKLALAFRQESGAP